MDEMQLAHEYNTLPNRIRWMLKETMGADGEFERRRAELAEMGAEPTPVSDDAVASSFVNSVRLGGFMYELLRVRRPASYLIPPPAVHARRCPPSRAHAGVQARPPKLTHPPNVCHGSAANLPL